ncbi:DMT family transporter [Rhodobacteraceae bacterium N5(2021)]|uniref:DMT family transporter n=1 Tax=Gymnodinialimonas phycosphaerae TaxID=2841589 RepID=A0A975TTG0_9RHOB|nr:DMT family transporter [Gymnodinialimonas phycosphaerae]
MTSNLRGALAGLLAFGIFATHDVIVKYLGGTYAPFQIVFFSVLFGFPIVSFLLLRDAKEANLRPNHPWWIAARTAASVITGFCAFYAFTVLPLAQTYAILFAAPLLITVLAIPMLGETVGWRRGLAVVVGLCGVLFVLQPGRTDLSLGHAAALTAAFSGALASLIVRKVGRAERSVVMLLYPMVANFIVMGLAMPFVYVPMPGQDLGALAVVAAMALAASALLIVAYRTAPAIMVAPMQYSQILWATVYGVLLFDEGLEMPTIIGSAIIIASGIYIVLREDRGGRSSTTPVLRTRTRVGTPSGLRIAPFLSSDRRGPKPPG